jgi:hypothetical protein
MIMFACYLGGWVAGRSLAPDSQTIPVVLGMVGGFLAGAYTRSLFSST